MKNLLLIFSCLFAGFTWAQDLKHSDQETIINRIATMLQERYVFEDKGIEAGNHIKKQFEAGAYKEILEPLPFARQLTKDLQSITHDKHMRVGQRQPMMRRGMPNPIVDGIKRSSQNAAMNNGFAKVAVLEGNVGYLDLRAFAPVNRMRANTDSAMQLLSNVDAFILDLRNNTGGDPRAVQYLSSYFFKEGVHLNSLYYRETDATTDFHTLAEVAGKRLIDVPLFVLTAERTFSAGEECAYNFLTQERATLIGEVTGGGANPGGSMPAGHNLFIFVPTGRAINPITKTNWEGVGVKPHVEVSADEAYDIALKQAQEAAEKQREAHLEEATAFSGSLFGAFMKLNSMEEAEGFELVGKVVAEGISKGMLNESMINNLGYGSLQRKKLVEAEALMRANVKAFPQSANVYDSLGEVQEQRKKLEDAAKNFQKAVELGKGSSNYDVFKANLERVKKQLSE